MSNKTSPVLIALGVIALVCCCGLGILAISVQSTQQSLLAKQQAVQRGKAGYVGAVEIVGQKITGTWMILDKYLDHEGKIYKDLANARRQYDEAVATGTPLDQVKAAGGFNVQVQALAESNPQIASALLAQQTSNALEEAVNEMFTQFQDWQDAVYDYNSYRGRLFAPSIVGGMLGFPQSYEYWEGAAVAPDIKSLLQTE